MRLADIERVKHLSGELVKLRAALKVLKQDGPTKVRCFFFTDTYQPEIDPSVLITMHDNYPQFGDIFATCKRTLISDIDEIVDELKQLGVEPDHAGN